MKGKLIAIAANVIVTVICAHIVDRVRSSAEGVKNNSISI